MGRKEKEEEARLRPKGKREGVASTWKKGEGVCMGLLGRCWCGLRERVKEQAAGTVEEGGRLSCKWWNRPEEMRPRHVANPLERTPNGLFHLLLSSEVPLCRRSPHKYRASGPAPRHSEKEEHARNKEALARRKGREREDDDGLGTCGPHRSPVADVTRPRGFFKLWWWLLYLIRALLLFLRPPHCITAIIPVHRSRHLSYQYI